MRELLKTKNTTYFYEEKDALLISRHHGFFNLKKMEEGYAHLDDVVIHYKIVDVRKFAGSFMKIMPFLEKAYPKLKLNGLIAEAYVIGEDLIVNNLIDKLSSLLKSLEIQTRTFKTEEEASSWIASLNK